MKIDGTTSVADVVSNPAVIGVAGVVIGVAVTLGGQKAARKGWLTQAVQERAAVKAGLHLNEAMTGLEPVRQARVLQAGANVLGVDPATREAYRAYGRARMAAARAELAQAQAPGDATASRAVEDPVEFIDRVQAQA